MKPQPSTHTRPVRRSASASRSAPRRRATRAPARARAARPKAPRRRSRNVCATHMHEARPAGARLAGAARAVSTTSSPRHTRRVAARVAKLKVTSPLKPPPPAAPERARRIPLLQQHSVCPPRAAVWRGAALRKSLARLMHFEPRVSNEKHDNDSNKDNNNDNNDQKSENGIFLLRVRRHKPRLNTLLHVRGGAVLRTIFENRKRPREEESPQRREAPPTGL